MRKLLVPSVLAAALMVAPVTASAGIITFQLDTEFSGAQEPLGPAPWLTATFDDFGGTGLVQLTMDASGLINDEFVHEWLFNLDPTLNPNDLTITFASGVSGASATGVNAFKADGDGDFDIQFSFAQGAFGPGLVTTSVWTLQLAGLTANSFNFGSENNSSDPSKSGPFFSAAHVGGIGAGAGGSGWIGDGDGPDEEEQVPVPEPASLALLGMAALGVGARLRRKAA